MRIICLLLGVALISTCLWAQSDTAEVSGIVTDPQKAVVPGVTVTVVRIDTSAERRTVTNSAGLYSVAGLSPGKYEIQLRKDHFQTLVRSDLELHVSDRVQLNFELKLGATTQSITITEGNEMVNTRSTQLGDVIDDKKMQDLPLNGRSYLDLLGAVVGRPDCFR
jgi:hypothetical protein